MKKIRFPKLPLSASSRFLWKVRKASGACRYRMRDIASVTERDFGTQRQHHEIHGRFGFKLWGYALAEREFADLTFTWPQYEKIKKEQGEEAANTAFSGSFKAGKIIIKGCHSRCFLAKHSINSEEYSVIATLNLNGDYISDQLAAMVGGIGIAPGANINYNSGHAIFEATHGTAPNIAGKNLVNPSSLLLSSVMMLEYMGWSDAANLITSRYGARTFSAGEATHDLARFMPNGKSLGTKEFGDRIISIIETIKSV